MALGMWTTEQVTKKQNKNKKNYPIQGSVRPVQRATPGQQHLGLQGALCHGHSRRPPTGVVQQWEEQGVGAGKQGGR